MKEIATDVLIVGAGAAGISAAVAASRMGKSVSIVEKNSYAGGKAAAAIVGTICGLYPKSKSLPVPVCGGFPTEFVERLKVLSGTDVQSNSLGLHYVPYHPFQFKLLADEIFQEHHATVYYHSTVFSCTTVEHAIQQVIVLNGDQRISFQPKVVIDCSGEAIVSYLCSQQLIESNEYQAASQVFAVHDVKSNNEVSLSLALLKEISVGIQSGKLNPELAAVSIVPGSLNKGALFLKIALTDPITHAQNEVSKLEMRSRALVNDLMLFLKNQVAPFQESSLGEVAAQLGTRTGRRPMGMKMLRREDVLECKKSSQGIANGAWPIEFWEPGKKVKMDYFAENDFYQVPADCLIATKLSNLLFAGRSISADESAIASARVIGTCLQTGYAAGILASAKMDGIATEKAIQIIRADLAL